MMGATVEESLRDNATMNLMFGGGGLGDIKIGA